MSHTTKLKSVIIQDVSALVQAIADLKAEGVDCSLGRNVSPSMYYANQHPPCDYVLHLPKAQAYGRQYDVGFEKQEDGTYAPIFDEYASAVAKEIGAGAACPMPTTPEGRAQHQIGRFFQHYAKNAAMNVAAQQGMSVESSYVDNDGVVQLVLAV